VKTHATLSELLQAYFTDRLMRQRNASPNTVASHRDTFRLLLGFAQRVLRQPPTTLAIEDLTPAFLGRFLEHLERDRGNTPRSRNVRLAAIHSFFAYVALQEPGLGALAQRVLAIPGKRYKTKPVDFLTRGEIEALLAAPDQAVSGGAKMEENRRFQNPVAAVRTSTLLRSAHGSIWSFRR
jgi:site-specific recombinase XerD